MRRKQRSRAPKEVKKCCKERGVTGQGHPVVTTMGRSLLEVGGRENLPDMREAEVMLSAFPSPLGCRGRLTLPALG